MKAKRLTQKQRILKLLQEAGGLGVNSYGVARNLALQLPTRIYELKREGYDITTITRSDKSVDYILNKEPEAPKKRIGWEFIGNTAFPVFEASPNFSNLASNSINSHKPHDTATDVSLFD